MESFLTQQTITKGAWSLQPLQINKKNNNEFLQTTKRKRKKLDQRKFDLDQEGH
jgi:hypothetical protein